MDAQMNSRGQIAVFVIAAVIIVAMIVLVLIARGGPSFTIPESFSPEQYVSACVREAVSEETDIMIKQGGFVEPRDYMLRGTTRIAYLCKNINYYEPCINQYPRYVEAVRAELERQVKSRVSECLTTLDAELERRQYMVNRVLEPKIRVELEPDSIVVESSVMMTLSKGDKTEKFDKLTTRVREPLYNLATVASEIVRQEAEFCYFSNDGFSLIYPEFDIRRELLQEGTKLYTIKHVSSDMSLVIAVRGCVIPQGVG